MTRVGIVAAMERELRPLLANDEFGFLRQEGEDGGVFVGDHGVAIFGGIGRDAATQAAERLVTKYKPALLVSAGVAGAVAGRHAVGAVLLPGSVTDADTGACYATLSQHTTVLLTVATVAGSEEKRSWRDRGVDIVDMEGAAVAAVAGRAGIPFLAIKAVSDAVDEPMPPFDRFIRDGAFRPGAFLAWAAVRPWWWGRIRRLGRNTAFASRRLCLALGVLLLTEEWVPSAFDDIEQIVDP